MNLILSVNLLNLSHTGFKISDVDEEGVHDSVILYPPAVPSYGHSQSLGGAGTGADDLRLQTFTLEDVEESVTGRDRP